MVVGFESLFIIYLLSGQSFEQINAVVGERNSKELEEDGLK